MRYGAGMKVHHPVPPPRSLATLGIFLLTACTAQQAVTPAPQVSAASEPYGVSVEEEALVLRLEDRREFDPATAESWIRHVNPPHRARMALALGRIGPSTFVDKDNDREKDADERMAGVDLLITMIGDADFSVRRNAAFALGEIGDPAGVEALFAFARDQEHADVAAEAVEGLSKLAASVPLENYATIVADDREGVRARAIRYLFRFGTDDASGLATRYLDDPSIAVKREAVYALGRRPYAPARSRLELLLNDADTLTRAYAARAVGGIGSPESVPALLSALRDSHPWVRTNSARALSQIAEKTPNALLIPTTAEDALRVAAMTKDPDPGTRAVAVETLGYYARLNETARGRLVEIAVSGSPVLREIAVGAVAKHLGNETQSPLRSLIATDSRWVKIRALEGAAGLQPTGGAIREQLFGDADATVRATAIGGIPDDRADAELALIRRGLEDSDVGVRSNALDRFGVVTSASLEQRVETLRQGEERARADQLNDARLSAIAALGRIDFPDRETFLRTLLQDKDPVVRRTAADLIEQQLKKPRPQYTPLAVDRPLSDYIEVAQWARQPHTAAIRTSRGRIDLMLLPLDAPMTTKNFADLASRGYFNGTSFMRVVPNFVIQGGDPRNDMSGGPGYAIRDEINLQKYTRGALGMALSGPDTGGSQYFITHSPQPHLDGGYTVFGRVIGGMTEVVDQTERGDVVESITIDETRPPLAPDPVE